MIIRTKIGLLDTRMLRKTVFIEKLPCGTGKSTEYWYKGEIVRKDYEVRVDKALLCSGRVGLVYSITSKLRQLREAFHGIRDALVRHYIDWR
jgi:hypothetical protein